MGYIISWYRQPGLPEVLKCPSPKKGWKCRMKKDGTAWICSTCRYLYEMAHGIYLVEVDDDDLFTSPSYSSIKTGRYHECEAFMDYLPIDNLGPALEDEIPLLQSRGVTHFRAWT